VLDRIADEFDVALEELRSLFYFAMMGDKAAGQFKDEPLMGLSHEHGAKMFAKTEDLNHDMTTLGRLLNVGAKQNFDT